MDALTQSALTNGYKPPFLEKTGLSIRKEEKLFDRFRNRVIFPIHSLSGVVIGFGGRTLKQDKQTAKYLNSPESEIYHKSKVLYGLYFAKKSMVQNDKCYLVEGYTDVMALHQAGIENVVASSGTALTNDQIRLIKRFTTNITVLYDGDEAGIKASLRGIDLILEAGLNVRIVAFPAGEDPDSFAMKSSSEALKNYLLSNEIDFVLFKTRLLREESQNDPVKKATLINDIVRSIAKIPDRVTRMVYIKECATILEIEEKLLYRESDDLRKKVTIKNHSPINEAVEKSSYSESGETDTHERQIIRLLINYGTIPLYNNSDEEDGALVTVGEFILNELDNDEIVMANPLYERFLIEYRQLSVEGIIPETKSFTNHSDNTISNLAADLLSSSYGISKIWKRKETLIETEEDKLKIIVPSTILAYKHYLIRRELKSTEDKLKIADNEEASLLQQRYMILKSTSIELARKLGNRTVY